MSYVNVAVGATKLVSALGQGRADRMAAGTQAISLNYQGQQEEQAAQQQADIIRRAGAYAVSRADASYAASGVQVGSGSAAVVDAQIETDTAHDAFTEILNGHKRADALRAQAKGAVAAGSARASQTVAGGVASALQSGYKAYSGWVTAPPVTMGSNSSGYNGTQNNPSAYVGG